MRPSVEREREHQEDGWILGMGEHRQGALLEKAVYPRETRSKREDVGFMLDRKSLWNVKWDCPCPIGPVILERFGEEL